jgi:hypothetical protein
MLIVYLFLGALARVWYGADDLPKLLQNRGVQTAFMLGLFLSIYIDLPFDWINALVAAVITCWLQFQFWSRGHGICIDVGDSTVVSENDIKRYNDRWYHKVCDKLLPNHKYGYLYDYLYLNLRYACPMLPMMIFDWRYILIGLSVAPIYVFSNELAEREPWVFASQKWWWRRGWSLAELLAGAVVYGGCYLIGG